MDLSEAEALRQQKAEVKAAFIETMLALPVNNIDQVKVIGYCLSMASKAIDQLSKSLAVIIFL